jgi:N-hydroxyarylamine O-acetyltransferase
MIKNRGINAKKQLKPGLVDQVLLKLGIDPPPLTLAGLSTLYSAWCQKITFDNVQKLIHLASGDPGPLPGYDPEDFFQGWLEYGTGGTCWAGSDALYTLLQTLGFQVQRGLATMLIVPDAPPNHGTVIVTCQGNQYLTDTSILHGTPLPLEKTGSCLTHPAWGVQSTFQSNRWHIRWRPLHMPGGCICRIETIGVSRQTFIERNEKTRIWGPFNYSLYTRINRKTSVTGLAYGSRVSITASGDVASTPTDRAQACGFLSREMGVDSGILKKLPPDKPMPSPPL